MTNKITLLLFATLKELIGSNRLEIEVNDGDTVAGLKKKLLEQYPMIKPHLHNVVVSINQEFAFDADLIPANAEVGMFPPVSGGSEGKTFLKESHL